jgi:hypothetical protein
LCASATIPEGVNAAAIVDSLFFKPVTTSAFALNPAFANRGWIILFLYQSWCRERVLSQKKSVSVGPGIKHVTHARIFQFGA